MLGDEEQARAFVRERCDARAFARLERLAVRLAAANTAQNLVSASTLAAIWQRHIADSAQLLDHVPRETPSWLDLGSGAGFPGLVVAIMRPEIPVALVESRKLRIQWLTESAGEFAATNCRVVGKNLQTVETFAASVISARAFAPLERLVALSARFSTSATRWVLPKGRSAAQEVSALPDRVRRMFHVEHSVTDPDAGIVIGTGRPEISA